MADPIPIPPGARAGVMRIGDIGIPCDVLPDGSRVLTKAGMCQTLGCTVEELDALCTQLGLRDR